MSVCAKCQNTIDGSDSFASVKEKRFHLPCFIPPQCHSCKQFIREGKVVEISESGRSFHPACFTCSQCKLAVPVIDCWESNDSLMCRGCWGKANADSHCCECGAKLAGKIIKALEKRWHKDCWKCRDCKKPIPSDFNEHDGFPYCEGCYAQFASTCHACGKSIFDSVTKALGQKYHKECFVCSKCKGHFGGGTFFVQDGKPFCSNCK